MALEEVKNHKNVEKVIRYYLLFMPPKGSKSILDIGAGVSAPYKSLLSNRCEKYTTLDIRDGADIVVDLAEGCMLKDKSYEWAWCTETLEHISPDKQTAFVKEVMRICENAVFTFPTPAHPTFLADPGHQIVNVDFLELGYNILDKSTKTGRNILILFDKKNKISFENGKLYKA